MALKLALFSAVGLLLLFVSNHFLNNRFLSVLFLIIAIAPIFLMKAVMNRFIRRVAVDLKKESFSISVYRTGKGSEKYSEHYLNDINSYTIQFPNKRFSSIKLNFKNGNSVEYSFLQQKQDDTQTSTDEILKNFHLMIENYNQGTSVANKIILKPSFFASTGGLACIIGLCSLFIIAVCLHISYQTKPLLITLFFGLAIIIQLILKRKSDIDTYKKWIHTHET